MQTILRRAFFVSWRLNVQNWILENHLFYFVNPRRRDLPSSEGKVKERSTRSSRKFLEDTDGLGKVILLLLAAGRAAAVAWAPKFKAATLKFRPIFYSRFYPKLMIYRVIKSFCSPDDYSTSIRCTETFWSLCIKLQQFILIPILFVLNQ
jgi:hypothetical protein